MIISAPPPEVNPSYDDGCFFCAYSNKINLKGHGSCSDSAIDRLVGSVEMVCGVERACIERQEDCWAAFFKNEPHPIKIRTVSAMSAAEAEQKAAGLCREWWMATR